MIPGPYAKQNPGSLFACLTVTLNGLTEVSFKHPAVPDFALQAADVILSLSRHLHG